MSLPQRTKERRRDRPDKEYRVRRAVLLGVALEDHEKDAAIKPLAKKLAKCKNRSDLLKRQLHEVQIEMGEVSQELGKKLDKYLPSKYRIENDPNRKDR